MISFRKTTMLPLAFRTAISGFVAPRGTGSRPPRPGISPLGNEKRDRVRWVAEAGFIQMSMLRLPGSAAKISGIPLPSRSAVTMARLSLIHPVPAGEARADLKTPSAVQRRSARSDLPIRPRETHRWTWRHREWSMLCAQRRNRPGRRRKYCRLAVVNRRGAECSRSPS